MVFCNALMGGVIASKQAAVTTTGDSLMFRAANSEVVRPVRSTTSYLQQSMSNTATDPIIWTYSTWIKSSVLLGPPDSGFNDQRTLISAMPTSATPAEETTTRLYLDEPVMTIQGLSTVYRTYTTGITKGYAIIGEWVHLIISFNSGNAEGSRYKFFVDTTDITEDFTGTNPAADSGTGLNASTATTYQIGQDIYKEDDESIGAGWEGYMSDTHFIDGAEKIPADFTETNSGGVLVPKIYTGSYGNHGFWLKFESGALGTDSSGNSNDFTTNNIISQDRVPDCPENNYTILNAGDSYDASENLSDVMNCVRGGLTYEAGDTSTIACIRGTSQGKVNSGKWYWEVLSGGGASGVFLLAGISAPTVTINSAHTGTGAYYQSDGTDGEFYVNGSQTLTGLTSIDNDGDDIIMIALDMDTAKIWVGINGTWEQSGDPASGTNPQATGLSGFYVPLCGGRSNNSGFANFGQDPTFGNQKGAGATSEFQYTPPTGFVSMSAANA